MVKCDIGIDFGTANTKVFVKDEGLVLNIPSIVAFRKATGKLIEIGNRAYRMIGKNPKSIEVKSPFLNGSVVDYGLIKIYIKELLRIITKNSKKKPSVCLSVHSSMTNLERLAFTELISSCGFGEIFFIEESVASLIGSGFSLASMGNAFVVVNIGGGTIDLALVTIDGIVSSKSIKLGGQAIDEEIIYNVSKKYGLIVGKATAEKTKIRALTLKNPSIVKNFRLKGKDKITGLPKMVMLNQKEVCGLIKLSIKAIIRNIDEFITDIPLEIKKTVKQGGIILAGGGSLIEGLAEKVSQKVGFKTKLAPNPIDCTIWGIGRTFEKLNEFKAGFIISA